MLHKQYLYKEYIVGYDALYSTVVYVFINMKCCMMNSSKKTNKNNI